MLSLEILEPREVFNSSAIIAENQLPGNPQSEWDVVGAGDLSIQGFATDISVDQGQTVFFKVNSPAAYRIDVYRLGYYAGLGARKVTTISPSKTIAVTQPAPLTNAATGLIDAGNWSVTASWKVPQTAVSGIYLGRLVRQDTGGASHIIFVVRDDDGASDLLFQTSDTTWQAYNNWGGKSTYDPSSSDNFRAYAVSYNRPLTVRGIPGGLGEANSLFWSEYPMVRWLEANGYSVSYTTGVDTHRRGAELLEHKVFLSVGHDEYWSAEQRAAVEAARDAGVHLAFFSGNEVYWKIRWENSIDASGTPHRTLVCYKESSIRTEPLPNLPPDVQLAYQSGVEDPSPISTGLWRDLRYPDTKVEQLLTGQIPSVNRGPGDLDGTAIQVPAEYSLLRFWRNTSVATLQPGQISTLAPGSLGYEWDEDVDNGYRPAGVIRMSETTEFVPEKFIDPISWPGCGGIPGALCATCRGCAVAPGSATHTLTMYRSESGALVFGAGTIQWSWGLDGVHDGKPSTTNAAMRQATVNLLADMGVQPGSLQSGLILASASTDTLPPSATITAPASGSKFTAGTTISITGTASDVGGGIVAAVEVSVNGGQTWHRATGRNNWSYTWVPMKSGEYTLLARSVDDSVNLGTPSAPVKVNVELTPTSSDGLVSAYGFNAGSGSVVSDETGTGNHGTITGATWTSQGRFGGALSFNGIDSWVTIPDSNSLDFTTAFTLEAWVSPTSLSTFSTVAIKEASNGLSYLLYAADGPNAPPAAYTHVDNFDAKSRGTSVLPLNTWSHLAASYSNGLLTLFVNADVVASWNVGSPVTTSNGVLRFGGNSIWGGFFAGLIDEVRLYNRSLAQYEIEYNMQTAVGDNGSGLQLLNRTPAPGATGVSIDTKVSATYSADLNPSASEITLRDANNALVSGSLAYNAATRTLTFTPNAPLQYSATYTATATVQDAAGNPPPAPVTWSFTTQAAPVSGTLFGSTVPSTPSHTDTKAVEVGVKFQTTAAGTITALRFYKGTGNTGTHIGNLWDVNGNLLASVTFNNETATGWQVQQLSSPVTVSPNTTYVVSYFAPNGRYALTQNYFDSAHTAGALVAPASSTVGGNGVYRYGNNSRFPTQSFKATNYWVDVVFNAANSDTTPPTVTARTPAAGSTGVSTATTVTAQFSEPVQDSTIGFQLRDSQNTLVQGSLSYNATTQTATFTPNAPLAGLQTYTATVSGARDLAGNTMAPVSWSFTTGQSWVQTTVADFTAGTTTGTVVTSDGDGAIALASAPRDDFNGTSLSSAWSQHSWTSLGGGHTEITVSGGIVSVAGGMIRGTSSTTVAFVEGSVAFAPSAYQHFGLATDLTTPTGNSWGIFSTGGTTNRLLARVNVNGAQQEVDLGPLPTGFHTYRVTRTATGFEFALDGTVVATITANVPAGTHLRPVLSDFSGANAIRADWILVPSYSSPGTYLSPVLNLGTTGTLQQVNWTANTPTGTSLTIQIRTSTNGTNWSTWTTVSNGQSLTTSGQYFQYQLTLSTSDAGATPRLDLIEFLFT